MQATIGNNKNKSVAGETNIDVLFLCFFAATEPERRINRPTARKPKFHSGGLLLAVRLIVLVLCCCSCLLLLLCCCSVILLLLLLNKISPGKFMSVH